ncbi:ABC transporter permease [Aeromonas rivipollensis]|uniref:FtsX-like permease family protein n=1 Tax=Aeromonas rivipollensis TaxID=948519 RepID=UPI00259DE237|nr:FtsX-like permease family protein [Aeromonas rivipollensis]MDM5083303.1 ABC transporter permease [Aeromonas rivipollensis]MDM5095681.1 ABC transporter permease [Aeromonas rivipollensis]MDM5107925.1 ABC transporter permease [Aeromonas rivipollensis]
MLPLKALLRLYRAHPWLLLMSLAGLMLGVTLVVAIELLNHSARTNFVAARSQLAGEANYRLAPSGGLDEGLYVRLVRSQPDLDAMPQLHAWLKDEQGRSFQLLGMDLFNPGPLRRLFGEQPGREPDFTLSRADSVWLSAPEAKRLGWSPGQSRSFMLGTDAARARTLTLTLAGTFEPGAVPMERLLVTDIGLAQPLLGKAGRLDRIVFKLSDEEANTLQRALQTYYPHQPLWLEPISPALDASQLGDALALNLSALSLLAMAVGLFLVFNAQRFVQSVRRPQLAQLIILGMPPSRVLRYLALELLILATIGTLLGLLLGSLLALALMGQLTQALADLYGPNPIDLLRLSPTSLIKALLIGLVGTLAANLPGWWQLLRQSPLELREGSSRPPGYPWRRRLLAIAILLLCALCLLLPQTGLGGALFVAGGWLLAMALALPDALRALLGRLRGHGPLSVRLGVAETQYHLDRTAIAVMALQLAIAAAIGIGVMVSSFRSSVEIWLGQRLAADLYVSAPKGVAGSRGQLSEQTLTAILAEPDVRAASRRAVHPARWQGQPIEWAQMDFIPELKAAYPLLAGRWPATSDEVLASEPLTVRLGVKVGQTLEVTSEGGPRALTVTGVYQDYGSDKGQILHAFEGGAVQSLALFSTDPERLSDRLRARFGERVNLLPAPAIHAAALKVFDQTFVVTELLKLLILGIAFVGIGSAFMVLGLARRGELQTLQSLGIGPRHCRRLLVWQGAGLGLLTALLALPVGYGLAWVLIEVVNPRAFGWRLAFEAAPLHAVTALLLAPLCGALASWYAARRVV